MTRNMFLFVMIVQSHNSAPIFSFMAYHQINNKIIMTGDISGTETLILSRKPEYPEESTDLSQIFDKLYHIMLH
jgi:hypothetical protein